METNTPVEEDTVARVMNDMADFYITGLNRLFGIIDRKLEQVEERHNDIKTESHNFYARKNNGIEATEEKGTYFHAIYLHKDHIELIDWMLAITLHMDDIPYPMELVKELKNATFEILRKIEKNQERLIRERRESIEACVNKKPNFTCSKCGKNCLRVEGGFIQWCCQPPCKGKFFAS